MDRDEWREYGKIVGGMLTGKGEPMTDEEFDQEYPDWDEVLEEVTEEMQKRKQRPQ